MRDPNPLDARPTVDKGDIVCPNENNKCRIKCDGASIIISLEPISYAMQKTRLNPSPHCDYIIIYTKPDPRGGVSVEVRLVEIDPYLKHDENELKNKMETCLDIVNEIIKKLVGINNVGSIGNTSIKRVLVVSEKALRKGREELLELVRKRVIDLVKPCI